MTAVSKKRFISAVIIILFAASLPAHGYDISSFSVFAANSIYMKNEVSVTRGDAGVMNRSTGPWLYPGSEITLGTKVYFADGTSVYGDTVTMKHKASVFSVSYNGLDNGGTIRGTAVSPLELPLDVTLPAFPTPAPGTENREVSYKKELVLEPGAYRKITLRSQAVLILTGGIYHMQVLRSAAKRRYCSVRLRI